MLKEKPLGPKNALVFALHRQNKNEFAREAGLFSSFWGIPKENQYYLDPPKTPKDKHDQASYIMSEIMARKDVDLIAFFCHGFPRKLQCGFDLLNTSELALACKYSCVEDVKIVLYTCSAGDSPKNSDIKGDGPGNGGFADSLRDSLCRDGSLVWCQVDAHVTAGHTTRNPYVRRFHGDGLPEGRSGGDWLIRPGTRHWKEWKKQLKGELRFAYPMMFRSEIAEALQ